MPKSDQKKNAKSKSPLNGQTLNVTFGLNQSGRIENQNQTHNTKKEAEGPNTKR